MTESPEDFSQRVHGDATAESVQLACGQGHEWAVRLEHLQGPCPHGVDAKGKSVQVEMLCPGCGSTLSIVGEVGIQTCPKCRRRMLCGKCAAQHTDPPKDARCPECGGPPVNVVRAPAITFVGDVTKTISEPLPERFTRKN